MTAKPPVPNATNPPLPVVEGPGRRVEPVETVRANPIFASGGLKDGLDIAKCIALGATLGGMAGQFLRAAAISTEKVVEMMKLTKKQFEITMSVTGVGKLDGLKIDSYFENHMISPSPYPSPRRREGNRAILLPLPARGRGHRACLPLSLAGRGPG